MTAIIRQPWSFDQGTNVLTAERTPTRVLDEQAPKRVPSRTRPAGLLRPTPPAPPAPSPRRPRRTLLDPLSWLAARIAITAELRAERRRRTRELGGSGSHRVSWRWAQ